MLGAPCANNMTLRRMQNDLLKLDGGPFSEFYDVAVDKMKYMPVSPRN